MMINTLSIYLLTCTAANALVFHVQPYKRAPKSLKVSKSENDLAFNPLDGLGPIDMQRAHFCAEHFGECSVEEMEELYNGLHKERLQEFAFGGASANLAEMTKEQMEHFVMEEELELQLGLLSDITPDPTLFPEVEEEMAELPHLKDNSMSHKVEDVVHRAENALAMQETVLEESNLETMAICLVVLGMALGPQLISSIQSQ